MRNITLREAADRTNVPKRTIASWAQKGHLQRITEIKGGRKTYYIPEQEIGRIEHYRKTGKWIFPALKHTRFDSTPRSQVTDEELVTPTEMKLLKLCMLLGLTILALILTLILK